MPIKGHSVCMPVIIINFKVRGVGQDIIELLGPCLHNTDFSFQNKIYEQVEGVVMGSPVSPIVTNLYMENFEKKALNSALPILDCG